MSRRHNAAKSGVDGSPTRHFSFYAAPSRSSPGARRDCNSEGLSSRGRGVIGHPESQGQSKSERRVGGAAGSDAVAEAMLPMSSNPVSCSI